MRSAAEVFLRLRLSTPGYAYDPLCGYQIHSWNAVDDIFSRWPRVTIAQVQTELDATAW